MPRWEMWICRASCSFEDHCQPVHRIVKHQVQLAGIQLDHSVTSNHFISLSKDRIFKLHPFFFSVTSSSSMEPIIRFVTFRLTIVKNYVFASTWVCIDWSIPSWVAHILVGDTVAIYQSKVMDRPAVTVVSSRPREDIASISVNRNDPRCQFYITEMPKSAVRIDTGWVLKRDTTSSRRGFSSLF